jgi:uncharacterized protein
MAEHDDVAWAEYLGPHECWERLATTKVGRLGVLVDSAPEIFPVNFSIVDDSIVFRTDTGAKHRGIQRSPSVCFEVDRIDEAYERGWSVLVKGRAEQIDVRDLPDDHDDVRPWAVSEGTTWIRIVPDEITGRQIGHSRDHDID